MTAKAAGSPALASHWPAPLSPAEWDARFPGALDGVLLLAGAANVILQLARLPVAYGVMESRVESGSLFRHPFKRTRTTITYLAVATLGTTEEKLAYRQAVNQAHAQVYSTAASPVRYNAFDVDLQGWVAACLYWGLADARERFRGPLDAVAAESLLQLAAPLGTTLQVPPGRWPASVAEFRQQWESGLSTLRLDDTARAYLRQIAALKFLPAPVAWLLGPFHRFMTAGFLPPPLRAEVHFPWDDEQQLRFERIIAALGLLNRLQPRVLRQWPVRLAMRDFRRRRRKGMPLV